MDAFLSIHIQLTEVSANTAKSATMKSPLMVSINYFLKCYVVVFFRLDGADD
jgi:hypothetical protein